MIKACKQTKNRQRHAKETHNSITFNVLKHWIYSPKIRNKSRVSTLYYFHSTLFWVWMRNPPHRLMCMNTQSPVGDAVWGSYGTFWRWSLPGRSASLWVRFEGSLTSCSSYLLPLYRWNVISLLPASVAMLSPLLWTLSLWSHKLK